MGLSFDRAQWALILGGSSGFGVATALALARRGMSVAIVHRDRRGAMEAVERQFDEVRSCGAGFVAFNVDALSEDGRSRALSGLGDAMGTAGRVRLLLHSIAAGNLKAVVPPRPAPSAARGRSLLAARLGVPEAEVAAAVREACALEGGEALVDLCDSASLGPALLGEEDLFRTVHAMGTSLLVWAQDVFTRGLFAADARVLSLTSEGNEVAWPGYAAVAAAKAALEAASRALAVELGPHGVRANVIQPGVTDTPALRLIPGSDRMKARALRRNPLGRLTTPEDVADVICLLCADEAGWVNGALVRVDGGERVAP